MASIARSIIVDDILTLVVPHQSLEQVSKEVILVGDGDESDYEEDDEKQVRMQHHAIRMQ